MAGCRLLLTVTALRHQNTRTHTSRQSDGLWSCWLYQVVDGRCGEMWHVLDTSPPPPPPATPPAAPPSSSKQLQPSRPTTPATTSQPPAQPQLRPVYDACSSWWTQALTSELQPEAARAVAYGAGRCGLVDRPPSTSSCITIASCSLVEEGWVRRINVGCIALLASRKMLFLSRPCCNV